MVFKSLVLLCKKPKELCKIWQRTLKGQWKYSSMLCIFFTLPGNSIAPIALQRNAGEKPVEFPPSEVFEGLKTVFKREKCDSAKIDFRVQILTLVLLVCIDGYILTQAVENLFNYSTVTKTILYRNLF